MSSVPQTVPETETKEHFGVGSLRRVQAVLALVLLLCFVMTARQLHRPNLADFEVYDAAAEVVHEHRSLHMYDDADTGETFGLRFVGDGRPLTAAAHRLGIERVRLYIYPPILADLLVPFTLVKASVAGRFWLLLNGAALLGTAWFMAHMLGLRLRSKAGAAVGAGLLVLFSTMFCLIWGQVTILLLLLWMAGIYFYGRGRWGLSAGVFALATAIKLTPLMSGAGCARTRLPCSHCSP